MPAPHQVLLSEEITGSLRKLKVRNLVFECLVGRDYSICIYSSLGNKQGCCTLARDRYKSLEKRGLVVPSKKSCRLVNSII